jgi:hypothetical protein
MGTMSHWDEHSHPRVPKGTPGRGGEFRARGSTWVERISDKIAAKRAGGTDNLGLEAHARRHMARLPRPPAPPPEGARGPKRQAVQLPRQDPELSQVEDLSDNDPIGIEQYMAFRANGADHVNAMAAVQALKARRPRQSLQDAKTTEEISRVATDEALDATGHKIPIDLRGSDPEIAREYAEGILRSLEQFPWARLTSVATYGTRDSAYPAVKSRGPLGVTVHDTDTGDNHILLDATPSHSRLSDLLAMVHGEGALVAIDPQGLAVHEMGHVLEHSSFGDVQGPYWAPDISLYAQSDHNEAFAEAFASGFDTPLIANPEARRVVEHLRQYGNRGR